MTQFTLFDTALGWFALAWRDESLSAVRLPSSDREAARRGLLRRFPEATEAEPPAWAAAIIAGIEALLAGGRPDFADAPLDFAQVPGFHARVYAVARTIPPGETLTYGQVAERLGDKTLARDVGQALGRNPWPVVVPCHRVVAAGGKLGGFSAPGGVNTKQKLLAIEGAKAAAQPSLFG
jgi:methylated-DNA-[protein]-cysteine S-methyltransferase